MLTHGAEVQIKFCGSVSSTVRRRTAVIELCARFLGADWASFLVCLAWDDGSQRKIVNLCEDDREVVGRLVCQVWRMWRCTVVNREMRCRNRGVFRFGSGFGFIFALCEDPFEMGGDESVVG